MTTRNTNPKRFFFSKIGEHADGCCDVYYGNDETGWDIVASIYRASQKPTNGHQGFFVQPYLAHEMKKGFAYFFTLVDCDGTVTTTASEQWRAAKAYCRTLTPGGSSCLSDQARRAPRSKNTSRGI